MRPGRVVARGCGRVLLCPGQVQQLHHFVSASTWPHERLERVLAEQADRLVGGLDAVRVVDDTALVKQGRHSAGVQRQHCGQLGKRTNCQALVFLTLARGHPRGVADRLGRDRPPARARRAFGGVLGDAGYGKVAAFRHALDDEGLLWALGVPPNQKVFSTSVTTALPPRKPRGRAPKHPVPSEPSAPVSSLFANPPDAAFRTLSWRIGTKGPLRAAFAARRVRVADGPVAARPQHLPGKERWLVCEHRTTGERKFHLTNHPADATSEQLAAALKGRWCCEWAWTTPKGAPGPACTTTPCSARSPTPFCNPCGSGEKGARPTSAPSQARHRARRCPKCAATSSRPCCTTSHAAQLADTTRHGTC